MPTPSKGPRLGGGPAHERLMLNNLAGQLFEHKQITTTVTKAKRLRPVAERMITFAKRGDLASRRRVLSRLSDQGIVHVLFTEIAPAVASREGGYTRITKIGPRKGDKAPMAVIELVLEPLSAKKATVAEAEAATKRSAQDDAKAEPAAAEPVAESDETAGDSAEQTDETAESKFGPDSAPADEDGGGAPEGWTVKGNAGSMKYHSPDFPSYDATTAEYWFKDEAAAEAAGFARPGNAPAKDDA